MKYYEGEGVVRDLPLAKKWMEKAADQGDAPAQYELAMMYYKEEGDVRVLSLSHRKSGWKRRRLKAMLPLSMS